MFTFTKKERICSKLIIDKLFEGGNQSMAVYPLRAVYMPVGRVPGRLQQEEDVRLLGALPQEQGC